MSFQFESPLFLALLAMIPALILYLRLSSQRNQLAGLRYSHTALMANDGQSWRIRFRNIPNTIRMIALTFVIIALARPQFVSARDVINGQGIDIALALDISGSMASLDFQPQNRLEAAKDVIADFIKERHYDQIGLVIFASEAFNQSPMTVDHDVLTRLLENTHLATELNIQDGTAIGLGLANAASMLKDSDATSKVVILLTDGVNNSGSIDPLTAAQAAKTLGVKVYTIGAAHPGQVPVPVRDNYGRERVIYQESSLDEDTLKQIAEETGGLYFRAEDTDGLQQVYDRINELEKTDVEITTYTQQQELMVFALFPGLALMLADMFLRQSLFRRIP